MRTLLWEDNQIEMIDQQILPSRFEALLNKDHYPVEQAITDMVVLGEPAIGATVALGLALTGYESDSSSIDKLLADLLAASNNLKVSRHTAVNLSWAFDRLSSTLSKWERVEGDGGWVS